MNRQLVLFVVLILAGLPAARPQDLPPFTDKQCRTDAYPPPKRDKVGTFVLNLDLEPEDRWTLLVKPLADEINTMIRHVKGLLALLISETAVSELLDLIMGPVVDTLPGPYDRELKGIAHATGIPVGEIVVYNLYYEAESFCTGIVAQDKNGEMYHGRNFEAGIGLGWDVRNDTWTIKEDVMDLIINVEYQRGGATIAKGVHIAGYIGMLTGMKKGVLSMNMNARHKFKESGFLSLVEWVLGKRTGHWTGFLLRDAVVMATDFNSTVNSLTVVDLLVSSYIIVGGPNPSEGAIITRSKGIKCEAVERLVNAESGWYLMKTNYDSWETPPIYDDRRTTANKCLQNMTQMNVGFKGLYNVMSTRPIRNVATAYTTLMRVRDGTLITYRRYCPQPCYPW